MTTKTNALSALILATLALAGCGDTTNPNEDNDNEVITTVALTFTPAGGGDALEFRWADPENDGSPVIEDVTLAGGVDYTLTVAFYNELESPAEDITEEVDAESDQHQVFFTGTGVESAATGENPDAVLAIDYDDADANGLPIGLTTQAQTLGAGAGTLIVTLRHLPPENDAEVKVEGLAETVATEGFGGIPGDTDAQVTFPLSVQ